MTQAADVVTQQVSLEEALKRTGAKIQVVHDENWIEFEKSGNRWWLRFYPATGVRAQIHLMPAGGHCGSSAVVCTNDPTTDLDRVLAFT